MSDNKKTKSISLFIIVLIILAIAIIALLVYNIVTRDQKREETAIDLATGQVIQGELLELYNMEEYERIIHYFNLYLECLENKEYEKAYNMLDNKFKNNYFKTLDSYINYVKKIYPVVLSVTYNDFTRMGNYYVLDVTFLDLFSSTDENMSGKTQKFIFYETDYNEYTMSFQAE